MKPSEFVENIITKYIEDEELRELLITHSKCVALKALSIADECGIGERIDRDFVRDAAMLHDIGIVKCNAPGIHCHGNLPYICHGIAGADILRAEGLDEKYCRVCERHTGAGITAEEIEQRGLPLPHRDLMPETLEEKLICYADKFFSKSGNPAIEKSMDRVENSIRRHGDSSWKRFEQLRTLFSTNGGAALL